MIQLVPVYIIGSTLGVIGAKRHGSDIGFARLGIWVNCLALVPMNVIPILAFTQHLLKK
jgi:hypothetical protein